MQFHPYPIPDDATGKRPDTNTQRQLHPLRWRVTAAILSVLLIVSILFVTFGTTPEAKELLLRVGLGPAAATRTPLVPTPTALPTPIPLAQAFPATAIIAIPNGILLNGATNSVDGPVFTTSVISQDRTLLVGKNCKGYVVNPTYGYVDNATCTISTMNVTTKKNTPYYTIPAAYSGFASEIISADNRYIAFATTAVGADAALLGVVDTVTGAVRTFFNPLQHSQVALVAINNGQLLWYGEERSSAASRSVHMYRMNLQTFASTEIVAFITAGAFEITYPYIWYVSNTTPTMQIWFNLDNQTTFTTAGPRITTGPNKNSYIYFHTTYYYTATIKDYYFQIMRRTLPNGTPELIHDFQNESIHDLQYEAITLIQANDRYIVYTRGPYTMMWDIATKREIKLFEQNSGISFQQLVNDELYLVNMKTAILEIIHLA